MFKHCKISPRHGGDFSLCLFLTWGWASGMMCLPTKKGKLMCKFEEEPLSGMDEDELRDALREQEQHDEDGIGGEF